MIDEFSDFQKEILIGSMLGDGSLSAGNGAKLKDGTRNGKSNSRFIVARSIKDKEYLFWQYNVFNEFCTTNAISYQDSSHISLGVLNNTVYKPKEKSKIRFQTRSLPIFTKYRKEWYPDGKKHIPSSLKELSSLSIAIWFADDGNIYKKGKCLNTRFFTNGFPEEEVNYLISLLNDKYNEKFTLGHVYQNNKIQPIIRGSNSPTRTLLKDIDSVFPVSMERKSNIWRKFDLNPLTSS